MELVPIGHDGRLSSCHCWQPVQESHNRNKLEHRARSKHLSQERSKLQSIQREYLSAQCPNTQTHAALSFISIWNFSLLQFVSFIFSPHTHTLARSLSLSLSEWLCSFRFGIIIKLLLCPMVYGSIKCTIDSRNTFASSTKWQRPRPSTFHSLARFWCLVLAKIVHLNSGWLQPNIAHNSGWRIYGIPVISMNFHSPSLYDALMFSVCSY